MGHVPRARFRAGSARLMSAKILVDLRNVYSGEDVRRRGFAYHGVGVP